MRARKPPPQLRKRTSSKKAGHLKGTQKPAGAFRASRGGSGHWRQGLAGDRSGAAGVLKVIEREDFSSKGVVIAKAVIGAGVFCTGGIIRVRHIQLLTLGCGCATGENPRSGRGSVIRLSPEYGAPAPLQPLTKRPEGRQALRDRQPAEGMAAGRSTDWNEDVRDRAGQVSLTGNPD